MEQHVVFEFVETSPSVYGEYTDEGEPLDFVSETFLVSTRKIEAFKAQDVGGAFNYVERLIDDAMKGRRHLYASRKYSFGDTPEWFEDLKPDADCQDPRVEVNVAVGH